MKSKRKILACSIGFAISAILLSPYLQAATYKQFEIPIDLNWELSGENISSLVIDRRERSKEYRSILDLIKNKEFSVARKEIVEALSKRPRDSALYNLLGSLEAAKKNYNAAKDNYKKAVELDNNYELPYLGLAEIAIFEKQFDRAKNYYTQLIRINSKNYGAYIVLSRLLYKEGEIQKAIDKLLEGYVQVKGSEVLEAKLLVILGQLYLVENQPNKLLVLAKDLVSRYSMSVSALSILVLIALISSIFCR